MTVRVSQDEAKLLKQWIENGRRLDRIVGEMQRISYRLTEQVLSALPDP
ncbi:MAG: hypothetical protein Q7T30_03895 [Planctomycetota bacterium]|nr:hypothetical protein [Planctomycetota bacterium]